MKNNFEEYNIRKQKLVTLLEESKYFFDKIGDEKTSKAISDNIEVIISGEFEVVVVGEFSAGKSTFLNALMREKYLPSYTKETTATINYLRNRSESEYQGIVYYMDGHNETIKEIDGKIIEKYVSTKNDEMDVSKAIKHFDLYLDSPFLENKVTLIDSPGLNGMKEGLGEITDAQIKRSHAVIFMFSAEQPGKRSDFEYLKKIKDEVNTVFLVLNKIDCIKSSENQTIEDTVANLISNYKSAFPEDTLLPEVMPIAAYPALVARSEKNLDYPANHFDLSREEKEILEEKSLMKDFEEKLLRFLTNGEKTIMQIREPLYRLNSNLERSAERIKEEIDVVENERSVLELDEKIANVQNAIQELEGEIENQRGNIRKAIKTVKRDTDEYMVAEMRYVSSRAYAQIDEIDSIDTLDDAALNRTIEHSICDLGQKVEDKFRELFFDQVQEQYVSIISKLEERLEGVDIQMLDFDAKINVSANSIDVGIENFNEMKKDLEKQIKQIEDVLKQNDSKEDELIEMSAKAENLRIKLQRIDQSINELKTTFCPPEVKIESATREVERKGLGKVLDIFVGKKSEEYNYEDDSERKAYIREYNEEIEEFFRNRKKVEEEREELYGVDKKLEKIERKQEEKQNELQRMREREIEMKKKFNEEIDRKYEEEIKRVKTKAKWQLDGILHDLEPALKKYLTDNQKKYIAVLQDLLEQSITEQLQRKKQEVENLKKLRQDSNDNKEEILNIKRENEKTAIDLLEKSKALIDEIGTTKIEKREYKTI